MKLAIILLLIVAEMNFLADPMAMSYANPVAAAKAWEYIFQSFGSTCLFLLVGLFARNRLVWVVCWAGMVEEGERGVCRLAKPIGGSPPQVDMFVGLCGKGWYELGLIVLGAIAILFLEKTRNKP